MAEWLGCSSNHKRLVSNLQITHLTHKEMVPIGYNHTGCQIPPSIFHVQGRVSSTDSLSVVVISARTSTPFKTKKQTTEGVASNGANVAALNTVFVLPIFRFLTVAMHR